MAVLSWVMEKKKIDERTFDFVLEIVELYKYLIKNKEYILSKQMLRFGTSIGANVSEARAAQSRNDFISNMVSENGFEYLKAPIKRLPLSDCPAPASAELEKEFYKYSGDIVKAVKQMMIQN